MVAIDVGELPRSCDPAVSEWGNPPASGGEPRASVSGERLELKHLSRGRKRNYRDSVSSGERKRNSLNPSTPQGFEGGCGTGNMGLCTDN